jgi:hypothetical protein
MNVFKLCASRGHQALAATALTLAMAMAGVAQAADIAAIGTEGFSLIANGGEVLAAYEGNAGGYTALVYLGNSSTELFNNHATTPGTVVSLGSFAAGTELVFRMHVNDTGDDFYTGPAARNVDLFPHARAQAEWKPGIALVSFEDLRGIPEGVNAYNDLSFSLKGVTVSAVPEPTGMALALVGTLAVVGRSVKRSKATAA